MQNNEKIKKELSIIQGMCYNLLQIVDRLRKELEEGSSSSPERVAADKQISKILANRRSQIKS